MEKYCALIIDIKKSKTYKIETRNELQEYLTKCIKLLNDLYQEKISFDVTFSAGDEIQGLFSSPIAAVLYWRMLEFLVYPVQLRAGIGIGEWNVRIEGGLSTEQDGPAYHNARVAIKEAYKKLTQRIRINSKSEADILANYLLNNSMGYIKEQNQTQNRLQLISEVIYPFVENEASLNMNQYTTKLLELKESYKVFEKSLHYSSKNYQSDSYLLKEQKIEVQDNIYITGEILDAEDAVSKKGVSSNIAEIMHKSRQNIDTVMRRGNILLVRSMDYMALQYIKKQYGGKV